MISHNLGFVDYKMTIKLIPNNPNLNQCSFILNGDLKMFFLKQCIIAKNNYFYIGEDRGVGNYLINEILST